jgi:hypothetical protein
MTRKYKYLAIVLLGAFIACDDPAGPLTEHTADVVGTLSSVSTTSEQGQYMLLVSDLSTKPTSEHSTRIYLGANAQTPTFLHKSNGDLQAVAPDDLTVGATIYANVGPIVLDSDPPQYGATRIEAQVSQ